MDVELFRTALIISLVILLLYVIFRKIAKRSKAATVPAVLHAELISLEVQYHPARLNVLVKLPSAQIVRTTLLDQAHRPAHQWEESRMEKGTHAFERPLPALADGVYYLEIATATQRTVRQFRLQ